MKEAPSRAERARERLLWAWLEANPNQPMKQGMDEVRQMLDDLAVPLDEDALFAFLGDEDVHYEYEDGPEREPILFVRWDVMWRRITAALQP